MIPLVRPLIPEPHEWVPLLRACAETGLYSNFGPCHEAAQEMLHRSGGLLSLPVANGTVALEVALQTTVAPGARVALPDFTFIATLSAVRRSGMIPVLFPVSRETWTIDPEALRSHRHLYDAVVVVSPFGHRVDFQEYEELSAQECVPVVYDLAGAWGMRVPHLQGAVAYSFHATKNLAIGEGGAVGYSQRFLLERATRLVNFDFGDHRIPLSQYGMNGKLDEVHCAMIVAHLKQEHRLAKRIQARKELSLQYQHALDGLCEPISLDGGAPYVVALGGFERPAEIVQEASRRGITVRRSYWPLLSDVSGAEQLDCAGRSDAFFSSVLALPSDVTQNEFKEVVALIQNLS